MALYTSLPRTAAYMGWDAPQQRGCVHVMVSQSIVLSVCWFSSRTSPAGCLNPAAGLCASFCCKLGRDLYQCAS